jgi:hypothetical protein
MRWTRPVSLLTAIACFVPLGAEDLVTDAPAKTNATDVAPVQIKDFYVKPAANLTFFGDTLTIDPKVLAGIGYDTNIFAQPSGENVNDGYYLGLVGVTLRDRLNEHNRVVVDGNFEVDRYFNANYKAADLTGGNARADYYWTDQRNDEIHAEGEYAKYRDPLVDIGEPLLRQTADASLYGTYNGSNARLVIGGSFVRTDYLENSPYFIADDRTNDVYEADLRIGWARGKDAFYYALAEIQTTQYANNAEFNNSTGYIAGIGAQVKLAAKTTGILEVGVVERHYSNNFEGIATYDDENVYGPYGNLGMRWDWEPGSHVGIKAFSTLVDSYTANAAWVYGGEFDIRYRLAARAAVFASVTYYHSIDDGSLPGVEVEVRNTAVGEIGAEYVLRRGLVTRVKADDTVFSVNEAVDGEAGFHRFNGVWEIAAAF